MAKTVIKLSIQSILNDLNDGIVWYASEAAFREPSIETKYGISKDDVTDIREHPALKGQEPASFTVIELIDDRDPNANTAGPAKPDNNLVNLIDDRPVVQEEEKAAPVIGAQKLGADFNLNFDKPAANGQAFPNFLNEL